MILKFVQDLINSQTSMVDHRRSYPLRNDHDEREYNLAIEG